MHPPALGPRYTEALDLARRLHANDRRKGTTIPYLAHLISVSALVLIEGGDEDEAIAALLHDALEDHPEDTSRDEISRRFGDRVLAIVVACTDTPPDYAGGKKPPWRERKEAYLAHVRTARPASLRVSVADKLDNARAMLADHRVVGDELWARFSAGKDDQLWYYHSLVEAYREAGLRGWLLDELTRTVEALIAAAR